MKVTKKSHPHFFNRDGVRVVFFSTSVEIPKLEFKNLTWNNERQWFNIDGVPEHIVVDFFDVTGEFNVTVVFPNGKLGRRFCGDYDQMIDAVEEFTEIMRRKLGSE